MPTNRASPIASVLEEKYKDLSWFSEIQSYLQVRVPAVEERMIASFRYVDVDSDNGRVFSYEFSSILNDACRTFGSSMDKILRNDSSTPQKTDYDIWDYYKLLDDLFKKRFSAGVSTGVDLTWVSMSINHQKASGKCLIPFESVVAPSSPMKWWSAHNKLKHSDIDNSREGNFQNAFNALAGVAFLMSQCLGYEGRQTRLFSEIGFSLPPSRPARTVLFFN
jgi:hypothetical protein